MKISIVPALAIGLSILIGATPAICAGISGSVTDSQGRPIAGVQISIKNLAGKILTQTTTDSKGHYAIDGLSPDTYDFILKPPAGGLKGGDAVSYLDSKGLTINWKLSHMDDAVAMATQGVQEQLAGDPFGLSMGEFVSAVVLGTGTVAAGVVGGYGAAGGFSSNSNHPTSPSM